MKKPYKIFLREFAMQAIIGIFPEERNAPQSLRANIELEVMAGELNDDYSKVPCYKELSEKIEALAMKLQPALLETLAEEIAKICLQHRTVLSAKVHLEKPDALGGKAIPSVEVYLHE